jgi:hypothetical protein
MRIHKLLWPLIFSAERTKAAKIFESNLQEQRPITCEVQARIYPY